MRIPTETKVLYEAISQVIAPYRDSIISNYYRLFTNEDEKHRPNISFSTNELLDMLSCISFEVENY